MVAGGSGRRFGGPQAVPPAGRPAGGGLVGARRPGRCPTGWSWWSPAVGPDAPESGDVPGGAGRTGGLRSRPGGGRRGDTRPTRSGPDWPRCPTEPTVIVVHDAARPLADAARSSPPWSRPSRAGRAEGAIPVLPVTDTLKRVAGGQVVRRRSTGTAWSRCRRRRPSPPPPCGRPIAAAGRPPTMPGLLERLGAHGPHGGRRPAQPEAHPARGPGAWPRRCWPGRRR